MSNYAHPEVLVNTQWVADNIDNPKIHIVESNEDILLYDTGHIPGAVNIDWQSDLQDQVVRDYVEQEEFEDLVSILGISTTPLWFFMGIKIIGGLVTLSGHSKCLVMKIAK